MPRVSRLISTIAVPVMTLTGIGAPCARAQWMARLDVGSAVRRELPAQPAAFPARFDAAIDWTTAFGTVAATGQAYSGFTRTTRSDVGFTGEYMSSAWARASSLRLVVSGLSSGTRLAEGVRRDRAELTGGFAARLLGVDTRFVAGRAWFASDAVTPRAGIAGFGLTRDFARGAFGISAQHLDYRDAIVVQRDTTYIVAGFPFHGSVDRIESVRRRYGDVEAHGEWWLQFARLDAAVGARFAGNGVDAEYWQRVELEIPMATRLALVGAAGRHVSSPEQRLPAYRFGSISLRVHRGANPRRAWNSPRRPSDALFATTIEVSADGVVTVRGVSGAVVELMGDFSDWLPITLTRLGATHDWRLSRALAPGAYHVVMRVDGGAWSSPPGLPVTTNEYEQTVGLLLVSS